MGKAFINKSTIDPLDNQYTFIRLKLQVSKTTKPVEISLGYISEQILVRHFYFRQFIGPPEAIKQIPLTLTKK